jgi:predicted acylesterase/phospholipase RssA
VGEELTAPQRSIGVAISGGGHRATLWGLGVLLALVDLGLNRRVGVITSVSGGSIANGVVGLRTDYRTVDPDSMRDAVRPTIRHIVTDGLFFYGPTTNRYLALALGVAAAAAAVWGLIVAIVLYQLARALLDLVGWVEGGTLRTLTVWPLGAAALAASAVLAFFTYRYSGEWNGRVGGVAIVGAAVGVGLMVWDVVADPIEWGMLPALAGLTMVGILLAAVAVTLFGRRSEVAQRALAEVHFGDATLADLSPPKGSGGTRHVICASEMQSGIHAFFTDGFVYSYSFGLSTEVRKVPLAFAVQASAALPGGFAPRRLETGPLAMGDAGEERAPGRGGPMILMDGGVYDNMADQWFVGMSNRRERWPAELTGKLPDVDDMLVANASTGWNWRSFGGLVLRIRELRELAVLGRIQSVMYNTIGRRRRAHLLDYWRARRPRERGTFVEVNDDPTERASADLAKRVAAIAPPGGWAAFVERTRTYPTVLRRIDRPTAVGILWHAYVMTSLSVHRFFDAPLTEQQLPTVADFEASLGFTNGG